MYDISQIQLWFSRKHNYIGLYISNEQIILQLQKQFSVEFLYDVKKTENNNEVSLLQKKIENSKRKVSWLYLENWMGSNKTVNEKHWMSFEQRVTTARKVLWTIENHTESGTFVKMLSYFEFL